MRILIVVMMLLSCCVKAGTNNESGTPGNRATASTSPDHHATLDSAEVRNLYQNGDFDKAIAILEAALKDQKVRSHTDSVFVYKHLGVMYAANVNTRERGKYYMLQLLTIEPTARIMDMYASDMIYMIFKNIQEEFATSHERFVRAENHVINNQATEPKPAKPPAEISHTKTYLWIGAGVLMVTGGVVLYLILNTTPEKTAPVEL